jgi:antitoxin (DNA-binding transcriptional repressor) of toxin-antitoxin stability system
MKATIVDLRYKMNDILKALNQNETITVSYHGKVKGILVPAKKKENVKITDHAFFGMSKTDQRTVAQVMKDLRGNRYDAV